MALPRRLLAAAAVVLGVAGIVLSLGGIPTAWSARANLSEKVDRVFDRIGPPVDRIADGLARVVERLGEAGERLRQIEGGLARIRESAPELDAATLARLKELAARLVTGIEGVRARLDQLGEQLDAINLLVGAANTLAPARLRDIDTQQLRQAAERIHQLSADAGALSETLKDFAGDRLQAGVLGRMLARLVEVADDVTGRVEQLRNAMQDLAAAQPAAREAALGWLDAAAVNATIVLLWIALAQTALLAEGLRWWRRRPSSSFHLKS